MRATKDIASQHICTCSPEPSSLSNAISNKISHADLLPFMRVANALASLQLVLNLILVLYYALHILFFCLLAICKNIENDLLLLLNQFLLLQLCGFLCYS